MEEVLTAHLLAAPGLAALVAGRVQWARRPQASALPAVILHRIGGQPHYTMAGQSPFQQSRIQADCWGSTYASAKKAGREVLASLSGLRLTRDGVTIQGAFAEGHDDDYEVGPGGADMFRVSMDFLISHTG